MAKDEFSWTELDDHFAGASWNPFVGCDKISDGCKNCYAMKEAFDQEQNGTDAYQGVTKEHNGRVTFTGEVNRQDSQFALTEKHLYVAMTRAMDALYLANPKDSKLTESMNVLNENGIVQAQTSRPTLHTE